MTSVALRTTLLHEGLRRPVDFGILERSARPASPPTRRPAPTMPARQAAPKPAYRIRNWKQYNDALVRRGSLTLWVDQETLRAWRYQGPSQRGAQFRVQRPGHRVPADAPGRLPPHPAGHRGVRPLALRVDGGGPARPRLHHPLPPGRHRPDHAAEEGRPGRSTWSSTAPG